MTDATSAHATSSPLLIWLIALGLSMGTAVSNGLARFSYSLVLPAMSQDLSWNYTQAGWINTANSLGYLLGAVMTFQLIKRFGPKRLFLFGFVTTATALLGSGLTSDFWILSFWRVLAGIGGAPVFIAGGVIASGLFADDKSRNALVISIYFGGGGGFGMLLSGLTIPAFIDAYGVAFWPLVWLILSEISFLLMIFAIWAIWILKPASGALSQAQAQRLPFLKMTFALVAYLIFSFGYIIYITFFVALMRSFGFDAFLVTAVWGLLSVMVMVSPFIWRPLLAVSRGGQAIAATLFVTAVSTLIPVFFNDVIGFSVSAFLFGAAFFMVPTAVTTFARKNLPQAQWGQAVSFFTILFAAGQTVGPVAAGILSDVVESISAGFVAAGVILLIGVIIALFQRPFGVEV